MAHPVIINGIQHQQVLPPVLPVYSPVTLYGKSNFTPSDRLVDANLVLPELLHANCTMKLTSHDNVGNEYTIMANLKHGTLLSLDGILFRFGLVQRQLNEINGQCLLFPNTKFIQNNSLGFNETLADNQMVVFETRTKIKLNVGTKIYIGNIQLTLDEEKDAFISSNV